MANGKPNINFANWSIRIPGLQLSSDEFYAAVEKEVRRHKIDRISIRRVDLSEYGALSARREYLEIYFAGYVYHCTCAPFGDGQFVSWWLGRHVPWFNRILEGLPVFGRFFRWLDGYETYYRVDIASMFMSVVQDSVLYVLDEMTQVQGKEPIPAEMRKPRMRDLFA